jgi:AraC-like DNA-binding protein
MSEHTQSTDFRQAFDCFRFDSAASPQLFPVMPQSHYFSEILLVRSGTCRITRGSHIHILGPGELIYIAPLIRHAVDSQDGKPVVFDVVKFSATRLKEIPDYLADLRALSMDAAQILLPIHMSAEDVRAFHMDSIIQECLYEYNRNDFVSDLHIRALIYLLITGLARFWIAKREDFSEQLAGPHDPIIDIPAYIEQHISESLRVEELARRCGLSYPWFAKRFHDHFGISCKQCIEQLRVEAVEQYLAYSDLDLAGISERTGYTDCSHLVKEFKRMSGMTPGQYRTLMKSRDRAPVSSFSAQAALNRGSKG